MSTDVKSLEKSKSILKKMYFAGVHAVSPKTLIADKVKFKDRVLYVENESFELKENIYLVGFGKAVMGMALVLEHMLGDYLKKGTSVVTYHEGGVNNQPDDRWWFCITLYAKTSN
ncbi:Glycerate kinase [Anthophora plagiata]